MDDPASEDDSEATPTQSLWNTTTLRKPTRRNRMIMSAGATTTTLMMSRHSGDRASSCSFSQSSSSPSIRLTVKSVATRVNGPLGASDEAVGLDVAGYSSP